MNPAGEDALGADRWRAVLSSVLVHAAVVGLLGWGWWRYRAPKPASQLLAIEATVVMDRSTTVAPAAPAAPLPAPTPTPTPPAALETPAAQEQLQTMQYAEEQRAAREHAVQQVAQEREAQKVAQHAADERSRQERDQRAQQAAEHKAMEAAQRVAQDKARRETELRAQLAAEERVNAVRGSAAEAAWMSLIRDRVTNAWIRPPSARAGVNCEVRVTQVPGGVVTGVQIGSCNGDAAVRESIEAAVYRASPLPSPSNPDLFDRNLKFNFHPDE